MLGEIFESFILIQLIFIATNYLMETVLDTCQTNITIYKYNTRVLKLFEGDQQGLNTILQMLFFEEFKKFKFFIKI